MIIPVFMRFKYMVPNKSKNEFVLQTSVSSKVLYGKSHEHTVILLLCVATAHCSGRQHIQTAWGWLITDHWPGSLCVLLMQPAAALASLSSNSFYCLQNGSFCGFILQWILEKQM